MSQYGNQGTGPNPYRHQAGGPAPRPYQPPQQPGRGSKPGGGNMVGWIVGIVLTICGLMVLCCCGGGLAFLYWDQTTTTNEIADLIRDNDVLQRHIGNLDSLSLLWGESQAIDDPDVCVYQANGSRADAKITIKWIVDHNFDIEIVWARLQDSTGRDHAMIGGMISLHQGRN